jgi:hypothetical protein
VRVWVDGWQVQCCGEPFAVGEHVRWMLVERPFEDVLTDHTGRREVVVLTLAEEHHGDAPEDTPVTRGRVRRLLAVTWSTRRCRARHVPRPGGGERPDAGAVRVDGWESELPPDGARRLGGYVVDLDVWDD